MTDDDFWKNVLEKERVAAIAKASQGNSIANVTMLFGMMAIAMALILAPFVADKPASLIAKAPVELDTLSTGSIQKHK